MKARVASAGTGKTTSLVQRYLEQIGSGTPLRRIAGVTFTHNAAAQLRNRVDEAIRRVLSQGSYLDSLYRMPDDARHRFQEAVQELDGATVTTIHGFMIAGLRLTAPAMGLHPDFSVIGEWEARAIFEEELASLMLLSRVGGGELHRTFERLGPDAGARVGDLFQKRSLAEAFLPDDDPAARAVVAVFEAAYARYLTRLGADLLAPSEVERRALTLTQSAGSRDRVVARHPVVLVDEFQDVNPIQGRFFEELERAGASVEVVGDPKQSIYGFRHADVEVFRRALRQGERLPPLTHTRRHARVVTRFLNSLTDTLAERGMGFDADEAPHVTAAGDQAAEQGRIELHWVTGERPIADLRRAEAGVLARRLRAQNEDFGVPFGDMAVLARSYASLRIVEDSLEAAGIPYVMLQGRGYYERQEIRDLVHALRVGLEPSGLSLAAWLRSPFAQLEVAEVERVMRAADPMAWLEQTHPNVADRLRRTQEWTRGTPLDAMKHLIRSPFIDGRRYVEFLDDRARDNVDALLFTVASRPPTDISALLERLALLARQTDAGDVPQAGEGVQLLTVHRSKGLEWPVVAVFDLGRMTFLGGDDLYLDPELGQVSLPSSPGYSAARARATSRDEQETYRLLYVAASRPRHTLLLTGSVKGGPRGAPEGWAIALDAMGLGPDADTWDRDDFMLQVHPVGKTQPPQRSGRAPRSGLQVAAWTSRTFPPHPLPPLQSPSTFAAWEAGPARAGAETEPSLPGRGAVVGTLVHFAIGRDWHPDDPEHLRNLLAQEVMFPFTEAERDALLTEVADLLRAYHRMLGTALPALLDRSDDRAEIPFAMRMGASVWQGVIDRLYRTDAGWWIDDYKTDRVAAPERYHLQAAVYRRAVAETLGAVPAVRLAYLRSGDVVTLERDVLDAAIASLPD